LLPLPSWGLHTGFQVFRDFRSNFRDFKILGYISQISGILRISRISIKVSGPISRNSGQMSKDSSDFKSGYINTGPHFGEFRSDLNGFRSNS